LTRTITCKYFIKLINADQTVLIDSSNLVTDATYSAFFHFSSTGSERQLGVMAWPAASNNSADGHGERSVHW
jgi:hypothetical protein